MAEMTDEGTYGRRGGEILGLPVYTIDAGKQLGEITGLMIRREDRLVPVIRVRLEDGGKQAYIEYNEIRTLGVDIALVDSDAVLHLREPDVEPGELDLDLTGRPVFTRSGTRLGHVVDFGINTTHGKVVSVRVESEGGFLGRLAALVTDKTVEIPDEQIVSLGPDAVIVEDTITGAADPEAAEAVRAPQGAVPA